MTAGLKIGWAEARVNRVPWRNDCLDDIEIGSFQQLRHVKLS